MIVDGSGKGYRAAVNADHQLLTRSTILEYTHFINHVHRKYFTTTILVTADTADNCVGYIKNNDDDNLTIWTVYLYSSINTLLTVKIKDRGTAEGTLSTIVPVNCNAGSTLTADVTAYSSGDITGLSGGSSVVSWFAPANDPRQLNFTPGFIIPKNQVVTFYLNQSSAAAVIGLGMCFSEVE